MAAYKGTLTPEHLAEISRVRDEWMTIALSTERCDRPAAEATVAAAYRAAGFDAPQVMIWMDSPLGGVVAKWALKRVVGGQLRGQLGDQLGDQLGGQLRDQLRGQLRGQLEATTLGGQVIKAEADAVRELEARLSAVEAARARVLAECERVELQAEYRLSLDLDRIRELLEVRDES